MPAPFSTAELAQVQLELMRIAAAPVGTDVSKDITDVLSRAAALDPEGSYLAVGLGLGFGLTICRLTGLDVEGLAGEGWGWELVNDETGETLDSPDDLELSPHGRGLIQATRVVIACANAQTETARDLILAACSTPAGMAHLLVGLMHIYRGARAHGAELWQR